MLFRSGIKIKAHPQFRLVATMNDDASTFDLPEYIHSRLQPQILLDFPERHEEFAILKENLPFGDDHILNYVTDFLQNAHASDERFTARDGINIARFAMKLASDGSDGQSRGATHGAAHGSPHRVTHGVTMAVLELAITQTLGEEALRYVPRS